VGLFRRENGEEFGPACIEAGTTSYPIHGAEGAVIGGN
jgi:hypothetical protein